MTPPLLTCMHWISGIGVSKILPVLLTMTPGRVTLATQTDTVFDTPAAGCEAKVTPSGVLRLTVAGRKHKLTSVRYTNVPALPDELVQQVRHAYAVASGDPQLAPSLPPLELLVGSSLVPPTLVGPGGAGLASGVRGVRDQRASAKAVLELLRLAGAVAG